VFPEARPLSMNFRRISSAAGMCPFLLRNIFLGLLSTRIFSYLVSICHAKHKGRNCLVTSSQEGSRCHYHPLARGAHTHIHNFITFRLLSTHSTFYFLFQLCVPQCRYLLYFYRRAAAHLTQGRTNLKVQPRTCGSVSFLSCPRSNLPKKRPE